MGVLFFFKLLLGSGVIGWRGGGVLDIRVVGIVIVWVI